MIGANVEEPHPKQVPYVEGKIEAARHGPCLKCQAPDDADQPIYLQRPSATMGRFFMPTQSEIAAHLGMSQQAVSQQLGPLGLDWKASSMDAIRLAYIEHLRAVAAGHRSVDGFDLARERAMTEQVDRELKQITLAEKKGQVVNLIQLEPELARMVVAFRTELLSRDDKLKAEIDALYGIDLDLTFINEHTRNALAQLARYDPGGPGAGSATGASSGPAGSDGHDGLGA